ncbi:hypothetical protein PTKIN_Ptkin17bG0033400 [Pterospermum kingtungense]
MLTIILTASMNICSMLMLLFLTSGVVMANEEKERIIKENNCVARMGMPCVKEVFTSILKKGTVTDRCCEELFVLGKLCHSTFVRRTLENPILKIRSQG